MNFIEKLNEDQRKTALKVIDQAEKMGIPPRLAVSLAFQESGLRQDQIGADGEIGIMQIKPTTAELIGFSRDDIKNEDTNIRAGLTYLKQGLDRYKDPVLAVAGYNAGMDHPYLTDPSKKLPESTFKYLESIKGLGGFTEAETPTEGGEPAPQEPVEVSEDDFQLDKMRVMQDLLGAGAGAALGKGADVASGFGRGSKAMQEIAEAMRQPPAAGATSGEKWARNWAGQNRPGVGGVPQAAAAYERSKGQGPITSKMTKMWGSAGPGEPTALVDRLIARGQPPAPPGVMQRMTGAVGAIPKAIARSPVASGALGGLSAVESGSEFMNRVQQKDPIGAALAAVGTVGGAASVVPLPPVRAAGLALSTASPLALYLYDKMRSTSPQAAQQMLSNVDIQGNPMP